MANVHIDRLGEINWASGIGHTELTDAGLITKRVATRMQLDAHPKSAERANVQLVSADGSTEKALRIPLREIMYGRPIALASAIGSAVFGILKAETGPPLKYIDAGYPAIHSLTLDEMVRAQVLTTRVARQINLAGLNVQPEDAKATIVTRSGGIHNYIRLPLVGGREYDNNLEVALETSMAMQAILTGQEIYQDSTPGTLFDFSAV